MWIFLERDLFSVLIDVTNSCRKYLYKQIHRFGLHLCQNYKVQHCTGRQWGNKTMTTNGGNDYYKGIERKTKHRYKEKIDLISNCDPYTIKEEKMVIEIENFPSISYPAIVNNFLFALFCSCLPSSRYIINIINLFLDGSKKSWSKSFQIAEFLQGE